jgi:hypothetical protein
MTATKTRIDLPLDVRSYQTAAGLDAGIERHGLGHIRHIVVKTYDNRWTAIFMLTELLNREGGDATVCARRGFMSV